MHSLLLSHNAIPSVVHAASARQHRQSLIRPRLFTALCAADGPAPSSSNGSKPDAPEPDDPVAAMMWAAQQDGVQVLFDEDGEDADYLDDILDDLEDPWMRNPSPPEWSESPLFAVPGSTSSTGDSAQAGSSKSDTVGAPDNNSSSSSSGSQDALPGSQVATVTWQQLQELVQQQEQQAARHVILLEVLCPEGQDQQQQPGRPLPEHLLQLGSNTQQQDGTMMQQQQQQETQELPQQEGQGQGQLQVQRVSLGLSAVTRDVALEWQQQAAVVAVWDSGHHSCLATAIRLSAVYRLPHVVLLQQQ